MAWAQEAVDDSYVGQEGSWREAVSRRLRVAVDRMKMVEVGRLLEVMDQVEVVQGHHQVMREAAVSVFK